MSKRKNRLVDNETELKAKNMTYYDVLGVSHDAELPEIKKQFRILAVKYHPDQKYTGDATIFALVARAYEHLSNTTKREEYDRMLAIEKKYRKSEYINQKRAFEEFIKAQETDVSTKNIEYAKSKFRVDWEDMDRKKNIKTFGILDDKKLGQLDECPLSSSDTYQRLKDIEMEREQEEIEFSQPEIFTRGTWDREKFNALFEYKYKQDKDDQLVKLSSAPSAFNDTPESDFLNCGYKDGILEGKYDNIFDDKEEIFGNNLYGSVKNTGKKVRVSKEDLEKIKGYKTDFSSHNVISKEYKNDIERRLREREEEDKLYDTRKIQDFDTDKTMGGYGFSHQVGLPDHFGEIDWTEEKIDKLTIKKLLAHRQMEENNLRDKKKKR